MPSDELHRDGASGAVSPTENRGGLRPSWRRIATICIPPLLLGGAYWALSAYGIIPDFSDEAELRFEIQSWGIWGPLLIVLLLTAAIIVSPLPSAPIAVAAGACFGSALGTIYTVLGAELGAIVAFTIARLLGYETIHCWSAADAILKKLGRRRSQNRLMAVVFASRLLPFLSFDLVSYAAGLTPLTFFRFALATLAGVIPMSFLLASIGDRMMVGDPNQIMAWIVIGGCVTLVPIAIKLLLDLRYPVEREDRLRRSSDCTHAPNG